jgi:hypothetical protein
MTFSVLHTDGSGDEEIPVEGLSDLYDELSSADQEHGDVSVTNDDNHWTISAHRDGRVVLMNLDTFVHCHMIPVPKEEVLRLWHHLIAGNLEELHREPWKPGCT